METAAIITTIIICSFCLWWYLKEHLNIVKTNITFLSDKVSTVFHTLISVNENDRQKDSAHLDSLYERIINQGIETKTIVLGITEPSPVRHFLVTYSYVSPTTKVSTRGRITIKTETFPNEQEIRTLVSNEHKIQYPIIDGLIEFRSESDYQTFIKVD